MAIPQVLDHGHCEICHRVVAMETRFCSRGCEGKHGELQAKKKRDMWKFIALLGALMLVLTLVNRGIL